MAGTPDSARVEIERKEREKALGRLEQLGFSAGSGWDDYERQVRNVRGAEAFPTITSIYSFPNPWAIPARRLAGD